MKALQEDKEREESFSTQNWFKPETNKKSEKLVNKLKKTQGLKPLHKRAKDIVAEKELYFKELRNMKEEKENSSIRANCTFQPNVSIDKLSPHSSVQSNTRPKRPKNTLNRSQTPTITADDFLEKQLEYEERRQQRMKNLKQKAEQRLNEENTYQPRINNRSREIASRKRSPLGIDKKLYAEAETKQKKLEKLRKEYMRDECPFQPSIHSSETSPFGHTVTKSVARDALEKLTHLIETEHGVRPIEPDGPNMMTPTGTALKSILKSGNKTRPDASSASKSPTQRKTAKKVYFRDRCRRNQVRSFHDNDGCFNIVFDKHSLKELKEHLHLLE